MFPIFRYPKMMADAIFETLGLLVHLTFIETDAQSGRLEKSVLTDFAGDVEKDVDIDEGISIRMAYDLEKYGAVLGLTTTPVPRYTHRIREKGGIRQDNHISTCFGFKNPAFNLAFATLFEESFDQELKLHHVGIQFPDRDAQAKAIHEQARKRGAGYHHMAQIPPSSGVREFLSQAYGDNPLERFFIEYYVPPPGRISSNCIHVDVVHKKPEEFLKRIADISNLPLDLWGERKNGSFGAVYGEEGNINLSIGVRSEYTDPKDW